MKSSNTVLYYGKVTRELRNQQNRHRSLVLWFTGLSSSGKSTLAHALEEELHQLGIRTIVLDGDNVRHGLCGDLGFSEEDRSENLRRIGEMNKLFIEAGVLTLNAFISPFLKDREMVRKMFSNGDFLEIHVDCPLEICVSRDAKGIYRRARIGKIKNFTGISSPYEIPKNPEMKVRTDTQTLEESVGQVIQILIERDILEKTHLNYKDK